MANIAARPWYVIPYPTTAAATQTATAATTATLDQVDNSTNASHICSKIYVNRMNEKYHREDERLRTFDNWPLSWLDKQTLAQTGMFFTNEDDKVKCYFCEVEIGRWEQEDQPVPEHLRWSPNCPLLRRRTTNNVPLNADALDTILPPISYDICGSNNLALEQRENTAYSEGRQSIQSTTGANATSTPAANNGHVATSMQASSEPCSHPTGANNNGGSFFPEYPEYAIESARLRSFEDWPRNMKQKPQQLAEAGFFYTGVGDRVRCFSCGGGLKDWDDNDEPWEQHALWLSQCRFVKLIKGQLFLDTVKAKADAAAAEKQQQEAAEKREAGDQSPPVTATLAAPTVAAAAATSVMAAASIESGDVAPPTAAVRIYDKIVSGCPDSGIALASTMGAPSGASIREEKLCKICYADEYNTAFLPCGHVVACAKCASSVTKCPLCRKPFTDVMRVYFS